MLVLICLVGAFGCAALMFHFRVSVLTSELKLLREKQDYDLQLMSTMTDILTKRLVEKEVKASESLIRESFPQAVHIELEPDSKDKNIPAYQQTTEKKEREAMDQALNAVQQVLRARADKG